MIGAKSRTKLLIGGGCALTAVVVIGVAVGHRRQYDLHDGAYLARSDRYPCRQAPCAGRDHTEALVLTAGRSDHGGDWRPWLRLRDLVWGLGACWHSCPSGGQTSEGHRTRTGSA